MNRLDADEKADYQAALAAFVRQARGLGFTTLGVEAGYGEADFADTCHLSESGGRKLAVEVAPAVRRLAHRLGYDQEGTP